MIVRKHMSAPAITVSHDTDYKTAIGLMQKHRIRRLPVLDERGALAGIVAERDLLVAADHYLNSPVDVGQVMTRQVVTVGDGTPVVDAATVMIERKIGGLPVIDDSGNVLGIITETDLFKALASLLQRAEKRRRRPPKTKGGRPAPTATRAGGKPATKAKRKAAPSDHRKAAPSKLRKARRRAR
jgi:acetoin utilization protein AcuB